jgi:hypothetical protein
MRVFAAALFSCVVLLSGSALAAQQQQPMNRALMGVMQEAARYADSYDYEQAITAARRGLMVSGITAEERTQIQQLIASWQQRAQNLEAEDERITDMMRDGQRSMRLLKACADVARVLYLKGKIAECTSAVGP